MVTYCGRIAGVVVEDEIGRTGQCLLAVAHARVVVGLPCERDLVACVELKTDADFTPRSPSSSAKDLLWKKTRPGGRSTSHAPAMGCSIPFCDQSI